MAITKEKKNEISEKLVEIARDAGSVAFANFHGLGMSETAELRKTLKENEVKYYVAKKSLIKRAFKGENFEGVLPELEGEIALAYSTDTLAPSREILNFTKRSKEMKEKLVLLGGVYEGVYKNATEITEIASIPSIGVLRGMFVNVLVSPIQRTAIALSEVAKTK